MSTIRTLVLLMRGLGTGCASTEVFDQSAQLLSSRFPSEHEAVPGEESNREHVRRFKPLKP